MADLQSLSISLLGRLPTTEEIHFGKSTIHEMDIEIENLEARIRYLRQKRAVYASCISPFRRLPTEILSEIVDHSLNLGIDITTITQICTRVRNAAFGMTTIWRSIKLQPDSWHYRPRYGYRTKVYSLLILYKCR
jgi:hypothetical protein